MRKIKKKTTGIYCMTLEQLDRIRKDPYYRGNGGEGKDYWDQKDEIDKRFWELTDRKNEEENEGAENERRTN